MPLKEREIAKFSLEPEGKERRWTRRQILEMEGRVKNEASPTTGGCCDYLAVEERMGGMGVGEEKA